MFLCKCGTPYEDPLAAAECEATGHRPSPDPVTTAERMIHVTMGRGPDGTPRGGYTTEAQLLMRSLSDQTLLISVRQIVASSEPVAFRDLLSELADRLDRALIELAQSS